MNAFMNNLQQETNIKLTEKGAIAHKTTNFMVYDLFAFGGAYRGRPLKDKILLFKNAFEEDPTLALKCLFYLRDVREGQGERDFFRQNIKWLCNNAEMDKITKLLNLIPEYGRWDDLIYATIDTKLEEQSLEIIRKQFLLDLDSKTPSLLAKWLPSENASAYITKKTATKIRKYFGLSHKQYRQALSSLREKIKIVEKLMSENRWNEIEFDKIPSKAGLIYKNAFARRDLIATKYKDFIKTKSTKVNAKTLYPYEIVSKALSKYDYWHKDNLDEIERAAIQKYWDNLPNYFEGTKDNSIMCVVDTSGSMTCGNGSIDPIDVAISLGIYAGERCSGPFQNHYISFASRPQLIKIEGVDLVDKIKRIYDTNLVDSTNLAAVFQLIKETALRSPNSAKDMPKTLVIISDMEIDYATEGYYRASWDRHKEVFKGWTTKTAATEMEKIRLDFAEAGLTCPKLVYWNVEARNNTILDSGDDVSFVSGCSPVLFEQICKGVTGYELMMDKLMTKRYEAIEW